MTKEYQMVMTVKKKLYIYRRYDAHHHTPPSTDDLTTKTKPVSGIITIKPHRLDDRQWDCIGFDYYGSDRQDQ